MFAGQRGGYELCDEPVGSRIQNTGYECQRLVRGLPGVRLDDVRDPAVWSRHCPLQLALCDS